MDLNLPPLRLRPALLAAGHTDDEIRRGRRTGELVTVRPGAFLSRGDVGDLHAPDRHALEVLAAVPRLAASAVVSHGSAAVLHGLPVWSVPLGRVHFTRARRTGGRVGGPVHVHSAPLASDEIVEVGGIAVTSPTRTVVDLTRSLPFEPAVVIADAALHAGLMDPVSVAEALARARGWPGAPRARRAVAFADGRSESVGESRSRVAMHLAGLPAPVLQWEVWRDGVLVARVDFAWPDLRTVGEFDGKVKYGRLLRPGQDTGDVVFSEKLREDAVRDGDFRVVRWIWHDLPAFGPTAHRLRRAFAAA